MLKWTKQLPTVPGCYWWRHKVFGLESRRIGWIFEAQRGVMFTMGTKVAVKTLKGCEFAGPIPEPED